MPTNWVARNSIGPDITKVYDTEAFALGTRIQAVDRGTTNYGVGEFIFLKGVASTAAGNVVQYYEDDWSTVRLPATTPAAGPVALAMAATVASTYGWYQIYGKGVATAATVADNARVWGSGTAATVDDATIDGYLVHNAQFASADGTPASGQAEVEIYYPYVDAIATND
jgi:hypothetical protein